MWMDDDAGGIFSKSTWNDIWSYVSKYASSKLFFSELFEIRSTKNFSADKFIWSEIFDFPNENNNS